MEKQKEETDETIFNNVSKIIISAKNDCDILLLKSIQKDFYDNEMIGNEIMSLYDQTLSNFEKAKEEINQKWKYVYLSNQYAKQLGYDKKISEVIRNLSKIKKLQEEILSINNEFEEDIKKVKTDLYNKNNQNQLTNMLLMKEDEKKAVEKKIKLITGEDFFPPVIKEEEKHG